METNKPHPPCLCYCTSNSPPAPKKKGLPPEGFTWETVVEGKFLVFTGKLLRIGNTMASILALDLG